MSSNFKYTAGLNNVGSYQSSGIPFATGSVNCTTATVIRFPYVTRWVVVTNNGTTNAKIGFSELGVHGGSNYFEIGKAGGADLTQVSPRLELKLTELWVSGSDKITVVAGLTNIPPARLNSSSVGINWTGSIGVG
tara:strand:+ start:42 stop:446 length:405 start_codon:yes stop_codon:yes gene_type:complete